MSRLNNTLLPFAEKGKEIMKWKPKHVDDSVLRL